MGTRGIALLVEFWGCRSRALRNGQEMASLFRRVNRKLGIETIHSAWRRLETGGVVGFSTSYDGHFAVRAWPSEGHVMVDIYSCRESLRVRDAVKVLEAGFDATRYQMVEIERGIGANHSPRRVPAAADGGMLPPTEVKDGGRNNLSGGPAAPQGVGGREYEPQPDHEGELEDPY